MEGTGSNLRLPLNPPFFAEADVNYDLDDRAGHVSTGFNDVIARDKPCGLIRVWDPNLRPQFTQQYNLSLEYQFTNTMSSDGGLRRTHRHAPGRAHRLEPAPPGYRRRDHLARVPARAARSTGSCRE